VDELAAHGDVAGKAGDAAAAFLGAGVALGVVGLGVAIRLPSAWPELFSEILHQIASLA
jgi:hypothetical protein